jgi:hypothetical protein
MEQRGSKLRADAAFVNIMIAQPFVIVLLFQMKVRAMESMQRQGLFSLS